MPTVLGEMVAVRLRMRPRFEIWRASNTATPPSRLLLVDCMLDSCDEGPEQHLKFGRASNASTRPFRTFADAIGPDVNCPVVLFRFFLQPTALPGGKLRNNFASYNDPSFDCGSRRCADACLRRDDATGRIECLNEMHVKNNSAAKCLLPREGVATRWCGVATPAPSPRPPSRPKKRESTSLWHSLFG